MNTKLKEYNVKYEGAITKVVVPDGDSFCAKYERHSPSQFYELDLLTAIKAHNRKGIYVDVGACFGNHTLFFAKHCLSTQVIAIEPWEDSFNLLNKNCARSEASSKITTHNIALGSSAGSVSMRMVTPHMQGTTTVTGSGDIPMQTFDDLITDPVAVIKLDVENYEEDVLKGATRALAQRPLLTVECQQVSRRDRITEFLKDWGYVRSRSYCATPTYIFSAA